MRTGSYTVGSAGISVVMPSVSSAPVNEPEVPLPHDDAMHSKSAADMSVPIYLKIFMPQTPKILLIFAFIIRFVYVNKMKMQ